jgi:hypothetical protein
MDYTTSTNHNTSSLGKRKHSATMSPTTRVSDKDINGPAFEIMAVIEWAVANGHLPNAAAFDPENPATYTQLKTAMLAAAQQSALTRTTKDWNTATENGWYFCRANPANNGPSTAEFLGHVSARRDENGVLTDCVQRLYVRGATSFYGGGAYRRVLWRDAPPASTYSFRPWEVLVETPDAILSALPKDTQGTVQTGNSLVSGAVMGATALRQGLSGGLTYPIKVSVSEGAVTLGDAPGQAGLIRATCSAASNFATAFLERVGDTPATPGAHTLFTTIGQTAASTSSAAALYATAGANGTRNAVASFDVAGANTAHGMTTNSSVFAAGTFTTSDRRTKRHIIDIDLKAALALAKRVKWYSFDKLIDPASVLAMQAQINAQGEAELERLAEVSFDLDGDGTLAGDELVAYQAAQQARLQEHAQQVEAAKLRSEAQLDVSDACLAIAKQAGVIAQELQALCTEIGAYQWLVVPSKKDDPNSTLVVDYNSLYAILEAATQERLRALEAK